MVGGPDENVDKIRNYNKLLLKQKSSNKNTSFKQKRSL